MTLANIKAGRRVLMGAMLAITLAVAGCGYKIGGPPHEVVYRSATKTSAEPAGHGHDKHKH